MGEQQTHWIQSLTKHVEILLMLRNSSTIRLDVLREIGNFYEVSTQRVGQNREPDPQRIENPIAPPCCSCYGERRNRTPAAISRLATNSTGTAMRTRLTLLLTASAFLSCSALDLQAQEETPAETLYRAGKWSEAKDAYEALVPTLPGAGRADALVKLGYCWQRLHKHDKAIPIFRQALELKDISNEQTALAMVRLGYSLRLEKQSAEAVEVLDAAANLENVPPNLTAEALLYSAWELNTQEQQDAALERFRKVEQIKDVHQNYIATACLSIGRIFQQREQYETALESYRRIETLNPVAAVNRARARVYALECESLLAGDQPFHIRPYLTKVTTDSALLQWVSQGESERGKVDVFATEQPATAIPLISLSGESEIQIAPLTDTICQLHSATLTGLKPHTRYRYQVRSGEKTQDGSFVTAPQAENDAAFSFSLIGDTQSYNPGLQPLLDAMGAENSDFVLHVGDVTDRGDMWGEWKASFFDPGQPYLNHSTFWPAYGNHDGGPYFPALFGTRPDLYYSFDWGDLHVVVLDSYGAGAGTVGRPKQLAWLKADLEQNDSKWTIAAMHVPMIATRTGLKSFGTDDFLPILEEHGVDIVFSGHHPLYRRYYPLGEKGNKPILHITSGGGGGPVGGYMPSPVLVTGINVNHYCRIDVRPDRLSLTAKMANETVIDRVELHKEKQNSSLAQKAIDTTEALRVISIYQELLTDASYELRLKTEKPPVAGETTTLILDFHDLPRGPLQTGRLPKDAELVLWGGDDSPWKITSATVSLKEDRVEIKAVAPANVTSVDNQVQPAAKIRLQLKTDRREFEPYDATARILVK